MKIAITGIAGFIGSNLAEYLIDKDKNLEIIGIDDLSAGAQSQIPSKVHFYNEDITSSKMYHILKNVDILYHFAAKNCLLDCQKEPFNAAETNILGTINIFNAAYANNVKKIIYSESSTIYEKTKMFPTPESEFNPYSFYGITKACNYLFTEAYREFWKMNIIGLRYFNVYGPKQDYRRSIPPLFSSIIIKLLKNESPIIYGDGSKRRDFIYIDDINDFHYICLLNDELNNETFNLGSGIDYSVLQIYNIICNQLNIHIPYVCYDDFSFEAQRTQSDISKAKKFGWTPKIDIETGIAKTIDWIKKNVDIYSCKI